MLRIVYAGTPEFAVPALQALVGTSHELVAVYTQPDRPAGRGRKLRPSPVKQAAEAVGLPVRQPASLRSEGVASELAALHPDIMIVAAYGLILPPQILQIPRYGCLNIHASLLPRWRGAAPIQRALLAGDDATGVTIMQMDAGLDTGDMLLKRSLRIPPRATAGSLHDALAELGAHALIEALEHLEAGELTPIPQDDSVACYAPKIEKHEAWIDWSRSAVEIDRKIRAFNPWPVAQTACQAGVLRIYQAELATDDSTNAPAGTVLAEDRALGILVRTGGGGLWLTQLQLPGGKPLTAAQFLNARSLLGERLTTLER